VPAVAAGCCADPTTLGFTFLLAGITYRGAYGVEQSIDRAIILLGVLLFLAPWVVGYAGLTGAAWTSWLVGALVIVVSLTVVRGSSRGSRQAIQH
jgi:hypothetical protein